MKSYKLHEGCELFVLMKAMANWMAFPVQQNGRYDITPKPFRTVNNYRSDIDIEFIIAMREMRHLRPHDAAQRRGTYLFGHALRQFKKS